MVAVETWIVVVLVIFVGLTEALFILVFLTDAFLEKIAELPLVRGAKWAKKRVEDARTARQNEIGQVVERMFQKGATDAGATVLNGLGVTQGQLGDLQRLLPTFLAEGRARFTHLTRPDIYLLQRIVDYVEPIDGEPVLKNKFQTTLMEAMPDVAGNCFLDECMGSWIEQLKQARVFDSFDILLSLKAGNSLFATRVAEKLGMPLLQYRSDTYLRATNVYDNSANGNVNTEDVSEMNFEGLKGQRTRFAEILAHRARGSKLRVLLVDDVFRGFRQLNEAVEMFNALCDRDEGKDFDPIQHVVVLVHVQASDAIVYNNQLKVHALISIGDPQMEKLYSLRDHKKSLTDDYWNELAKESTKAFILYRSSDGKYLTESQYADQLDNGSAGTSYQRSTHDFCVRSRGCLQGSTV